MFPLWLKSWGGCSAQCWGGVLEEEAVRVGVEGCSSTGTAPMVLETCVCGLKRCFEIQELLAKERV